MKNHISSINQVAGSAFVIALIALAVAFQDLHDTYSPPFSTKIKAVTRDLISDKVIPYFTFGFTNMIADSYWIRAVQDFVAWDGRDPYYLNYFKNISALDPKFEYPYLFSILIVPQRNDIVILNQIADIADKGIEAIPASWKIPFYLGTKYYHFTKEFTRAEQYLSIAASKEDAPDGVFLLYSTYVAKRVPRRITSEEDAIIAKNLYEIIFNNTDNDTIKKMAGKGIEETFVNQMMKRGIVAYNEKYKKYPKNLDELFAVNLITLPEEFLQDFTIEINQRSGDFRIVERKQN